MKYNLYVEDVSIEAVFNRLGGVSGAKRLLANDLILVEKSTLKPIPTDSSAFLPTFMRLVLPVRKNIAELRKALKGQNISPYADDLLAKTSLVTEPTELELVVASVKELGLKSGVTTKRVFERASKLGLDLCPAQVGPELRLIYQDQPKGEWLLIAMEQITGRFGGPRVFDVVRCGGGERWLVGYYADPGYSWLDGGRWVFVRRT